MSVKSQDGRASLGNTAKSASIDIDRPRIMRFALQSEARRVSSPTDRVQHCYRTPTGGGNGRVAVKYRPTSNYAYYGGLQSCGQIWKCPVCAAKITERRRVLWYNALSQIRATMSYTKSGKAKRIVNSSYGLATATFTIGHGKRQDLSIVLERLDRAYSLQWSGRFAQEWKLSGQVIGTIRALELTYGDNGWHPHIHTIFVTIGDGMRYMIDNQGAALRERWVTSADKAGAYADPVIGCVFSVADIQMLDYINKLGIETSYARQDFGAVAETTKFPTKRARDNSASVTELLGQSFDGSTVSTLLWQIAQQNLKGRRHISTSANLLRLLQASQELTDDKLASTEVEELGDQTLAVLDRDQWEVVIRRELQGQLLNIAQSGDPSQVKDFLVEIGAIVEWENVKSDD